MVKHTQTIRRLLRTNCLSLFDHFCRIVALRVNKLSIKMKICLDLHANMPVNNCLNFICVGRRKSNEIYFDLCVSHIYIVAKICDTNIRSQVQWDFSSKRKYYNSNSKWELGSYLNHLEGLKNIVMTFMAFIVF